MGIGQTSNCAWPIPVLYPSGSCLHVEDRESVHSGCDGPDGCAKESVWMAVGQIDHYME